MNPVELVLLALITLGACALAGLYIINRVVDHHGADGDE